MRMERRKKHASIIDSIDRKNLNNERLEDASINDKTAEGATSKRLSWGITPRKQTFLISILKFNSFILCTL